ncbi:MAG: hypothetical protein HQ474_02680 [Flammeovirgaceae bacterium]|jgi:hypothetical protein|nr:hypothetical protein [Flammeovirgaceae bacterium]
MSKFKFLLGCIAMCVFLNAQAQYGYYQQALLFSQTSFGGTARIQGIGGAQVALGGDLSNANANPAGLGFYNRGSFSFSPGLDFHKTSSDYLQESNLDKQVQFSVSQLGLSFYFGDGAIASKPLRGSSFAISINRSNDFYDETFYRGTNDYNSIINAIVEKPYLDIGDGAYENFLIDQVAGFGFDSQNSEIVAYDTVAGFQNYKSPFESSVPIQQSQISTQGSQYDINLAYGGNYMDWLYFGAGLSMNTLYYQKVENYGESNYDYFDTGLDEWVEEDALDNLSIRNQLTINGIGVTANFGIIVKPLNQLSIGLSYTTPSYMALEEEQFYDFSTAYFNTYEHYAVVTLGDEGELIYDDSQYYELGNFEYSSDINKSSYALTTAGKLNLGLAYFFGKNGFITGDIEFRDYSGLYLNGKGFDLSTDNQVIAEVYQSVVNYRMGAEFRFEKFKLRGGYSVQGDPYFQADFDRAVRQISTGIGYRHEKLFVDFTMMQRLTASYLQPYEITSNQPIANLDISKISALFTVGVVF